MDEEDETESEDDYSLENSHLITFPHLTHLNLLGLTTLTTEVFVKITPCFPALKMLVLTGCELLKPKAVTKAIAAHCPKLESISIDYTPIPYVGFDN